MKFESTNYFNLLKYKLIDLPIGKFYLTDQFILTEINPGIHLDWEKVETLIPLVVEHYGEDISIAYISNRVNSYSYDPNSWIKFERDYGFVIASAVVYYDELNEMNATLEKHLSQNSIKRCISIEEAIEWVLNLKELNN